MKSVRRFTIFGIIFLLLALLVMPSQVGRAASCTSNGSGTWTTASIWDNCDSGYPDTGDTATIQSGHVVTLNANPTSTSITVSSGGTLATGGASRDFGGQTVTVNGTFRIDEGGYASNGTFTYGSSSTLEFANTTTYGFADAHVYWPTSSGPVNVTVSGTCTNACLDMNSASRTVSGTFQMSDGVQECGSLTINGTAQINSGGYFDAAPNYGSSSTLKYNSGSTYSRSYEWSATSGAGYPANVQISNSTTLDLGNGGTSTARQMSGSLTIDSGSTLTMNASGNEMTAALTVVGSVTINGTLTLSSSSGGDIYVGGNWTRNSGGTFTANSRAVFFNGSADQTMTSSGGATMAYLIVNKSSGNLVLGNNLTLNATSGNVLSIQGGGIDLNGKTLTLSGSTSSGSSNIQICNGSHTISGGTNSVFLMSTVSNVFTRYVTTSGCGTAGTLTFGSNVTVEISSDNWQYSRFDPGSSLTTINGILKISAGGQVVGNSPTYGSASTLNYNCGGGGNYTIGTEWAAGSSGAGVPQDVLLTTINTRVVFPADSPRTVLGGPEASGHGIRMASNTTLELSSTCSGGTNACNLTVLGDWTNDGGSLSSVTQRRVVFSNTSRQQVIGGTASTTFQRLEINNSNDVLLQHEIEVESVLYMTNGDFDLDAYNLTMKRDATISISSPSTSRMIIADDGKLCKTFHLVTDPNSFLYPIGDNSFDGADGEKNYSPFTLDLPYYDDQYDAYNICAKVTHTRHDHIGSTITTDYIHRYWTLTSSGSGEGTFDGTFQYDGAAYDEDVEAGDVDGDEANMYGAEYYPSTQIWTWYDHVVPASNNFFLDDVTMYSQADYTALPKTPTAATMADMTAADSGGAVRVAWTTGIETDIVGFNVYRGTSPDGEQTLLTASPIGCQYPGLPQGADYEFVDTTAQTGVKYYYWIETVGPNLSKFFGPLDASWFFRIFLPFTR